MTAALAQAWQLLFSFNKDTCDIVWLSLSISLSALAIGVVIGVPIGALIAIKEFSGKRFVITVLNSLMGVPTVIVGVIIYLLLSRSGPLGELGLLFTPKAIVIAQVFLTTPVIAALSRQILEDNWDIHSNSFRALRLKTSECIKWLLWDSRFSLSIVIITGFARAISEVGAVMIVGGNINHFTRTMTTAIALETSKGDLPLALALSIALLGVVLFINIFSSSLKYWSQRRYGA